MQQTHREWLETDGLGGFASGTLSGRRTRRYHALLLVSRGTASSRMVLVNGLDAWVQTASGTFPISSQHYLPDVITPHGDESLHDFQAGPWPTWSYQLKDGHRIRQEIFVPRGHSAVVLRWSLLEPSPEPVSLILRPFLSGRDYHQLHYENSLFRFEHEGDGHRLQWNPYPGVPAVIAFSNGQYQFDPQWYRQFYYSLEAERGLDFCEDLAAPGLFHFELDRSPAVLVFTTDTSTGLTKLPGENAVEVANRLEKTERVRRLRFASRLHRSADQYLIRSGDRQTIIAGYPWFTDWGRDTFISLRGLCLATDRLDEAGMILEDWARTVSEGMVPNRFPDGSSEPEYNSVDASLWYVIASHDYFNAMENSHQEVERQRRSLLHSALGAILSGYARGTRFGIEADKDGLLRAGVSQKTQLTWMDAMVDDWIITPRVGKPVEVQALWINALWIGSQIDSRWLTLFRKALASFRLRFWNENQSCLFDVVDADHIPGRVDDSFRPNQIFAVGGLPLSLLDREQARRLVGSVEKRLVTPLGLRTLDPAHPDYRGHYIGDRISRDGAYHQGTAWPWLIGSFAEAWLRVHGDSDGNRSVARARFVQPLLDHLEEAGLGHISEIADGDFTTIHARRRQIPRGCPFQAWSLGELLRVLEGVLQPVNNSSRPSVFVHS